MALPGALRAALDTDMGYSSGDFRGMLRRRLTMNWRFCRRNCLVGGRIQTSQSM
jgi:hypothetical protein